MAGQANQLSRYGAIAKSTPFTTGRVYFLVSASETAYSQFSKFFPQDGDGYTRVYTTWAALITQIQLETPAPTVIVSPLFTTAPTKAQQLALDAAYAVVIQAAENLPDGSYLSATLTALSLATSTTNNLFQVNGRIILTDIVGEVVTTTSATAANAKFTSLPTVGSTTDLCATGSTTSAAAGAQMVITGTLANALVVTTQSAVVRQATPLIITAGTLQLITSATTTGNVKVRVKYVPLDHGAFVSPLI